MDPASDDYISYDAQVDEVRRICAAHLMICNALTTQRCPGGLCSGAEQIDQLSGMHRAGIASGQLKPSPR